LQIRKPQGRKKSENLKKEEKELLPVCQKLFERNE
jgi:hypothetical protein